MNKLIEAFHIFDKYSTGDCVLTTDLFILYVNVEPDKVSTEDRTRLETLRFHADYRNNCFYYFI